jgi:hypothetical protein
MLAWNYGAALILDGMFESVAQFGFDDWVPAMSKYMDAYTTEPKCRGYKLAHNITMPWDSAVGDQTGLFPISFLQVIPVARRCSRDCRQVSQWAWSISAPFITRT